MILNIIIFMNEYKVYELKSICKGLGIKGYSKLRKKELIKKIEDFQNPEERNEEILEEEREDCECSICYNDEKENEVILQCGHSFCEECIKSWEKINKTCPLCRKDIKRKKRKNKKIQKKYVKVIDMNDYMSEEEFINYMRNLNLIGN